MMQVKSMLTSVGLGMVAGAAAVLMLPKHSQAFRVADDTAQTIKHEAGKILDNLKN